MASNGVGVVSSSSQAPHAPGEASGSSLSSLPPQMQAVMAGMTREKLGQLMQRMQQLKSSGENENTSPEFANLLKIFRAFQQYSALRQQQAQAAQASASQQAANGTSSSSNLPPQAAADQPVSTAPNEAAAAAAQTNGRSTESNSAEATSERAAFSHDQIAALKAQIMAYKLISRNIPVPEDIQHAIFGREKAMAEIDRELSPLKEAGEAGKAAAAALTVHSSVKGGPPPAKSAEEQAKKIPRPPSPSHNPESPIYPYNAFRQPWTHLSKPGLGPEHYTVAKQQRLLIPTLMPRGLDPQLLYDERNRFIDARIEQRKRELESLPATMSQSPTVAALKAASEKPEGADDEIDNPHTDYLDSRQSFDLDNAKVKALIELKSLDLRQLQRQVREKLVTGFAHTTSLALDRTAYRRWKKTTLRDARKTEQMERENRTLRDKQARQGHTDYLSEICNHGRELQKAHAAVYAQAQRMGKAMQRFHIETEKEEQRRMERVAKERLNALRADDEEAYLKLIDTAKDTRITHLIRQTDTYLSGLAQSIQAQQNDEVHADAIAAERAGNAAAHQEELARQAANQVVGGPVDETMFGAQKADDEPEDKGKTDYYSVAHRITEKITEQPGILVGGQLKEYQIKGLQWMISLYNNRLNGILADEMGLGKTIQTISLITFLIESKRQQGPFLVIVPLSTLTNWVNEFNKWAPTVNVLTYKGAPNVRKAAATRIRQGDFQVLLTTYEYIIKDKNLLGKIKWIHMIIDEGHRMKNTQSKLTMTLTQFYTSRYRLLLTGTPLQNNLPELWALLNFVLPRIFNSVKSFDEWFNSPFAQAGAGDSSMQLNEEEALLIIKRLHKVLRPFLLRRLKKDVESEMPDKVEKVIKCKMSALQLKLYQQMKKHKMIIAGDDSIAPGAKKGKMAGVRGLQNVIMQLRKICNHPYVFEQVELTMNPSKANGPDLFRVSGKFELLDRLLPKLKATNHRTLIFFQMTAIMDIMEDFLRYRGFTYLRLDGNTKPDDRSRLLTEFNAPNSEIFIFILSTRAGGLGLNLQTADTVIIYDSDWNPHQDLQAQDRAHRIGQKMEVRILRLVTEKSVEEQILARAQDKLEIDGKVIQAGKFDNQATAEEREDLLRAMLEDDTDDEAEESGDLNDEELNELLARRDDERERFREIDVERERLEQAEWKAAGNKGKAPDRLLGDSELPALYQRDFDAEMLEAAVEEEPAVRKRAVVHYDDGLTEDQFLRALEDEDVDLADVVEKKRERAEKRKAKHLLGDSHEATPEPAGKGRKGKGKKGAFAGLQDEDGEDASPGASARKRKRGNALSPTASVSSAGDASTSRATLSGKRPRKVGDDPVRQHIAAVLLQCYRAAEACVDDTGRKRSTMFQEIPKKSDYPDYHVIIQRPISLRQIKRRIDNKTYTNVHHCKDDIHLMAANAKMYNEEGSWVYVDAVELQAAFDKMYSSLIPGSGLPGAEGPDDPGAAATRNGSAAPAGGSGSSSAPKSNGGQSRQEDDDEDEEEDEDEEDEEEEEEEEEEEAAPAKSAGMKIKLKRKAEPMDED